MGTTADAASKISLVLADVDGTLVTAEKVLTARAQAAVKALHSAGISFAITSGRPPRGMAMLIDPLALRTPIAGFNGGIFVKPDMTIMEEHVLAADAAKRALDVILHNKMDVWFYSGKDWLVRDPNAPHVAREQWTVKFAPTVVQNFEDVLDRAVKIVLMFRKSGLSIAMGNASAEVQAQANLVTDSYDDEGFAKAIERFILPHTSAALPRAS